ncbi:MAG: hypothetical protein J1E98_00180 [Lachnospiraceae bacterium]|nr:hypothetical protein [Lachnospiraceae bacterium]
MDHKETSDIESFVAKTPFHMEVGWELVLENSNKNCSHSEIELLLQKRIINLIDIEIMKILARYPYTNSGNIAFLLNYTLHQGYQKPSYLSNLNKLKKAGIILRYAFADSAKQVEGTDATTSPLRLYCLSQAAHTYMASITPNLHQAATAAISAVRKLELASLNQFLIRFQQHYSTRVDSLQYIKGTKIGSTPFTIDSVLCCSATHPVFEGKEYIWLFVFSCREYGNWTKNNLTRLKMLRIWLQRHSDEYPVPFVIFLVENLSMALTLYSHMQEEPLLQSFSVYFCPDSLLVSYPPLDAIYSCRTEEDGHLTAIRHSISF